MKVSILTEWLFYHIWKKNPRTKASCPGILVPHTIIFRWGSPLFWYFCSPDGEIRRKGKNKISAKKALQMFSLSSNHPPPLSRSRGNNPPPQKIIAVYYQIVDKNDYYDDEDNKKEFVGCEYFNEDNLANLLFQRRKIGRPILQKFVTPMNNMNSKSFLSPTPLS